MNILRGFLLVFALTAASPPAAGAEIALPANIPPILKAAASVEGEYVRLGDLFDNLRDRQTVAVAYAPPPGKRAVFDARFLAGVAQTYNLSWQPSSRYDRIVIDRPGQIVGRDMIEAEIRKALGSAGQGIEVEFAGGLPQIQIPVTEKLTIALTEFNFDDRTRRFSGVLETPAGSPQAARVKLFGRIFTVTEIPVLARNLTRGEVINERDLKWQPVRSDQVRTDAATRAEQLVGLATRGFLRADMPVRLNEVQRPVVVTKGSLVTMVLKQKGLMLTAQAKALEDGGAGDTIRVSNTHSNTVVEAVVDAPNRVTVATAHRTLAQN